VKTGHKVTDLLCFVLLCLFDICVYIFVRNNCFVCFFFIWVKIIFFFVFIITSLQFLLRLLTKKRNLSFEKKV
jgi:hypothetical protein